MSIRNEIRELCIAHDRFMAEQASRPIKSPTVSETDEPRGLIYKRFENASAAGPEPEPPDSDPSWEDALDRFSEATVKALEDDSRRLDALERENAELRGKLDALLTMLGQKSKLWLP